MRSHQLVVQLLLNQRLLLYLLQNIKLLLLQFVYAHLLLYNFLLERSVRLVSFQLYRVVLLRLIITLLYHYFIFLQHRELFLQNVLLETRLLLRHWS